MSIEQGRNNTSANKQLSVNDELLRRKRINKYKKIIIWTCGVLIIIPIIMCIILMVRIHMLENDIDDLLSMKESGEIVAEMDSAGNRYLVLRSDSDNDNNIGQNETVAKTKPTTAAETTIQETTTVAETTTADTYTGKRAYLTFDDGPSVNTEPILEVLNRYQVPATFFVIGKNDDVSMKLYKEIIDRGSYLALHSFTHDYKTIYSSVDSFVNDITRIHDLVLQATGKDVRMFRFPGGSATTTNTVDMKQLIKYLKTNGYKYVDWNVSSEDATGKNISAAEMANIVVSEALSCNHAYILMHDARGKETTVQALPQIIEQLQANGFKFYGVDNSTQPLIQQVKESTVQ